MSNERNAPSDFSLISSNSRQAENEVGTSPNSRPVRLENLQIVIPPSALLPHNAAAREDDGTLARTVSSETIQGDKSTLALLRSDFSVKKLPTNPKASNARVGTGAAQENTNNTESGNALMKNGFHPLASNDNFNADQDEHTSGPTTPSTMKVDSPDHATDEEELDDRNVCMESVLKEAARTTGVRLTWILYSMIFLVIALFIMILVQTTYTMNAALRTSGKGSVQTLASSLLTNAQLLQYDLDKIFDVVDLTVEYEENSTDGTGLDDDSANTTVDEMIMNSIYTSTLCDRLFGAPELVVNYGDNNKKYALSCGASEYTQAQAAKIPFSLPSSDIRTAALSNRRLVSYRYNVSGDNVSATGVILSKELIGRNLLSNDVPAYSTGTLQRVYVGILLGTWNDTTPSIVMHSLDDTVINYTIRQPTTKGAELQALYQKVCTPGSPYIWHTVARSDNINYDTTQMSLRNTTKNGIPKPYETFAGAWHLLSHSVLCMAICTHETDDTCTEENPTTIRYIIDYTPYSMGTGAVNIVSIISIIALVLFSLLAIVSYFSITIPVNYLRTQLLHVISSSNEYSSFYKHVIRLSHPVWLGELVALVRTFNILRLCYQLNIKYVPEHVLKQQAMELYSARSKLNVIYKVDLDDHVHNSAEESDDEDDIHEMETDALGVNKNGIEALWSPNAECEMNETTRTRQPTSPIPHNVTVSFLDTLEESINVTNVSALREDANPEQSVNIAGYLASVRRGCKPPMTVRNVDDATIMCVYLQGVDDAFVVNYALAVKQHRRLMRFMLNLIRRHNGTILQRSGEYFTVAWNAFGNCSAHAEKAATCAIELASAMAPYRRNGLDVGILLHKGMFVCGIVEDSKEAFTTAFGSAPRQAHALSQLVSMLPYFQVVVSEPVKQALSSNYDFNIVDVIRPTSVSHQFVLFELQGRKSRHKRSMFVPSYTNVFQHFRNHEFSKALEGIHLIRKEFPGKSEPLLFRLELLCNYYSHHGADLPKPYSRPYPVWVNYEMDAATVMCAKGTPMENVSPGGPPLPYNLSGVYKEKAVQEDDVTDFKKELHINAKRIGSPALRARNAQQSPASISESGGAADKERGSPTFSQQGSVSRASAGSPTATPEAHWTPETPTPANNSFASLPPSTAAVAEHDEATMSPAKQKHLDVLVPLQSTFVQADPNNTSVFGQSIIQSVGFSFREGEQSMSMDLPNEIEGKNGVVYMKSAQQLGKGSFGSVYLGMESHSGKLVAIKFLPFPLDESQLENVEAEVSIMQRVKDMYVVDFITYAFVGDLIVIVMECMMAGSLQNMISAFHTLPCTTARVFMRDVLRGLNKLHSCGVIHRDIKPQNVLLTLTGTCKISDFGASAWLQQLVRKETAGQVQGTPVYLSPEAARGKPVKASDIWSCGIVYLQLITGRLPYTEAQLRLAPAILVYQIGSGLIKPDIPSNLEELDTAFVTACLRENPEDRPTTESLLEMTLFYV